MTEIQRGEAGQNPEAISFVAKAASKAEKGNLAERIITAITKKQEPIEERPMSRIAEINGRGKIIGVDFSRKSEASTD
jgi:hypothetical protein